MMSGQEPFSFFPFSLVSSVVVVCGLTWCPRCLICAAAFSLFFVSLTIYLRRCVNASRGKGWEMEMGAEKDGSCIYLDIPTLQKRSYEHILVVIISNTYPSFSLCMCVTGWTRFARSEVVTRVQSLRPPVGR